MTPEIPPKKNPPVNLAQPSAVWSWSGTFFLPVKVNDGAIDGSPSLNEAIPYIVRQMLRITTNPPAANGPAAPAYSVFLNGPAFTNGPTRKNPCASPTSIPRNNGLTAVSREVWKIPCNQWAWCDWSLQASNERVTINGLNYLVIGLNSTYTS